MKELALREPIQVKRRPLSILRDSEDERTEFRWVRLADGGYDISVAGESVVYTVPAASVRYERKPAQAASAGKK